MVVQETINDHSKKWNLIDGTTQYFLTLNFHGLNNTNLGTRVLPMGFVPPKVILSKVRVKMLKMLKMAVDSQKYKVIVLNLVFNPQILLLILLCAI